MPRQSFGEFHCSISRTVDVIGDAWTPLIIRDVFLGVDTFSDLAKDLELSRALLSARLNQLVAAGVLDIESYSDRPPRHRYRLTRSGLDLVPVLIAMMQWGDKWRAPDGVPLVLDHDCGHELGARFQCTSCGEEVTADRISARPGPGGRHAPGTAVLAQRLSGLSSPS